MSERSLKLEVVLSAIDKATRPIKAVLAGSKGLAREVKATTDRLKDLDRQQATLAKFRDTSRGLAVAKHQLTGASEKLQLLKAELAESAKPTKQLTDAIKVQQGEVDKLRSRHGKLYAQSVQLKESIKGAGLSTTGLTAQEKALKAEADALNITLEKQKARLQQISKVKALHIGNRARYERGMEFRDKLAGGGVTTMAAGAAMGAPVIKMIRDYTSFEDAMLGVARQVDGAKDANGRLTPTYYAMGDAIKAMAEKIPMATTEIAELVEGGARMGIQGKENLLAFARTAALASTAFDLPAGEISENMGKIAMLYKVPIKNISQLGDVINYLDDNAQSKGADIIDVMQRIAGSTGSMDYKQAAALGSTFLSLGASSEIAATATKAMVRELQIAEKQPKRFQKGLKELHLNAKQIQADMAKDSTGTIERVMQAVNKLPKARQMGVMVDLMGKEYAPAAAKLAANLGEWRRQRELAQGGKAAGSMQRESDSRNQTLSAQWQMLQNKLFNSDSSLGANLRQPLLDVMQTISEVVGKVTAWTKANPALAATLVKIGAATAIVVAVLGGMMLAVSAVLGPLVAMKFAISYLGIGLFNGIGLLGKIGMAFRLLGVVIGVVGRLFMLNPIGLAITAIAGAAFLIWRNWGVIGPKFAQLWEWMKGVVKAAGTAIMNFLMNWTIVGFIARHWEDIKAITYAVWGRIKDGVMAAGRAIVSFFMNWTLLGVIVRHWDGIKAAAGVVWDWIKGKAIAVGNAVVSYFMNWTLLGVIIRHWDGITGFLSGLAGKFMTIGGQIMNGLISGFIGGITGLKNAINNVGDSAISWMKEKLGIHSPSRVFAELGGFTMAGLHQGLLAGADGPLSAVKALAAKLTAAGAGIAIGAASTVASAASVPIDRRPPVSMMQPAPAVGGLSIGQIVIHAAPGMDERKLAQMVVDAIAKHERDKQARSRGRLGDRD